MSDINKTDLLGQPADDDPEADGTTTLDGRLPSLSKLRVDQSHQTVGVRREYLSLPVKKPAKGQFVRVHPEESFAVDVLILEHPETRDQYVVNPDLETDLALGQIAVARKTLYFTVDTQGNAFLWPVRAVNADGSIDSWNESAHDAARRAREVWLRIHSNQADGQYNIVVAEAHAAKPIWPDKTIDELVDLAFKRRYVGSADHPLIRRLSGDIS